MNIMIRPEHKTIPFIRKLLEHESEEEIQCAEDRYSQLADLISRILTRVAQEDELS